MNNPKKFLPGFLVSFVTFFVALVIVTDLVYANPGDLDSSFGYGGKVFLNNSIASDVLVQSDGKILMAGNYYLNANTDFYIARYEVDGVLDTTFGNSGIVVTDFGPDSHDIAYNIIVQPDNKIVVSGRFSGLGAVGFVAARYHPDGSLDSSFGTEGRVKFVRNGLGSAKTDFEIQPDGKFIITGPASGSANHFLVIRLNSDGSIDSTFGVAGETFVFVVGRPSSVVVQPDGKLVVVGHGSYVNGVDYHKPVFVLVRLNSDGSLDQTFGVNGVQVSQLEGYSVRTDDAILLDNGDILVGGSVLNESYNPKPSSFMVARFNPNGNLDASFGSQGVSINSLEGLNHQVGLKLAIQNDGKIILSGWDNTDISNYNMVTVRFNQDGGLDAGFGLDGGVVTDLGGDNDVAYSIAIQTDGSLVVVGYDRPDVSVMLRYLGGEPANQLPTANAGSDLFTDEGASVSFDATSSSDPDGYEEIVRFDWDFGDGSIGTGEIINHVYADDGVYIATLTVTDSYGEMDSDDVYVTVSNVNPVVSNISAPVDPQATGAQVQTSAGFTDVGVLDTHTASWDWGDGNSGLGTIVENGGSGVVTGDHAYIAAGVYSVTLTVDDGDGGVVDKLYDFIVIYDPNGGSVRGGGTIDSPPGAYTDDASTIGSARFGFSAKYQNGAQTPTGNTRFSFRVADFNFVSTDYDWLVVAGARAMYKGSGEVNRAGDYGFNLSAIDGELPGGGGADKFRLKVWDKATGEVVYDNQQGTGVSDNPTTLVTGGKITISQ